MKKQGNLSYKNLGAIISIVLISIYMIVFTLSVKEIANFWKMLAILGMVIINIAVVYLYGSILEHLKNKFEEDIQEKEQEYQKKQFEVVKAALVDARSMHHDISNQLNILSKVIQTNPNLATEHIKSLTQNYLTNQEDIVDTGNDIIDSIINYKIPKMKKLSIDYRLKINIPKDILLDSSSMALSIRLAKMATILELSNR